MCKVTRRVWGTWSPARSFCPVLVKVTEGRAALELMLEIEWGVVGSAARSAATFSVVAKGQRTDVKWEDLALREPYSLEVVHEGDFFGRKDAVRRILRRLGPDSMQSCYITGQKRVGKSSLARVVEAQINNNAHEGGVPRFVFGMRRNSVFYGRRDASPTSATRRGNGRK